MSRTIEPNEEFIANNFTKVESLVKEYVTDKNNKQTQMLAFLQRFQERIMLCPGTHTKDHYNAYPGGLLQHIIDVYDWLNKFAEKTITDTYDTFVTISVLHDIGKLGTAKQEYYLPTKEKWKREKGIFYDINPEISFVKIPHRSLYLAQVWHIPLKEEEFMAILLSAGQNDECNREYKYKCSELSYLFSVAKEWAILKAKEDVINYL
jgi:hypothetical protein